MRKDDEVRILNDQQIVQLFVNEGPVPGVHDDIRHAGVRMTIEEALHVLDQLKKTIAKALDHR